MGEWLQSYWISVEVFLPIGAHLSNVFLFHPVTVCVSTEFYISYLTYIKMGTIILGIMRTAEL